jgi:hypothetical protein
MTETEEPGYAERDDDETSEQTGGGVDPAELDVEESEDADVDIEENESF